MAEPSPDVGVRGLGAGPGIHAAIVFLHALRRPDRSAVAVWVAATLFAGAHLPSPILTTFTLAGGLFFCEMFRRCRSIYPIGIVHAVLGLTIAVTMPESLLHNMRVGIGYLRY
ncbi:MAG TPA: CPBP family intramembrane glutamic endopeptidase [Terriglobales bacterium]|nr:CPBP family intramembrane glutamic endopeptidase [Terriglobales bacterium]